MALCGGFRRSGGWQAGNERVPRSVVLITVVVFSSSILLSMTLLVLRRIRRGTVCGPNYYDDLAYEEDGDEERLRGGAVPDGRSSLGKGVRSTGAVVRLPKGYFDPITFR